MFSPLPCSSWRDRRPFMSSPPEGARGEPSRGSTWSVWRPERTWPFLAPMGFTLPVRVMSVLKEISAVPPSKRRGLVKVQGQGTQCGPWKIVCPTASLPPLPKKHVFKDIPMSPKKMFNGNPESRAGASGHTHSPWQGFGGPRHSCDANQILHIWQLSGAQKEFRKISWPPQCAAWSQTPGRTPNQALKVLWPQC